MNTRWNFSFDSTIVGRIHPEKKFPASRERDCQGMEDLFRMDAARSQKVLKWHNSFPYFFFSFVAMFSLSFFFLNLQINIKWIQTVPQTFYDTEEAAWEWRWPRRKIYLSWCTWVFAVNIYCSIRIGVQIGWLTKSCNYSSMDLTDNLFCSGHTSHPSPSLSKQNLKEKLKTSSCLLWSLWAQKDSWIWFIKAGITAWSQSTTWSPAIERSLWLTAWNQNSPMCPCPHLWKVYATALYRTFLKIAVIPLVFQTWMFYIWVVHAGKHE